MFDVAWGDTAGETVAQRRQRKEREQKKSNQGKRRSSIQSGASSSDSSKAQSISRTPLFGIFGSSKKSKNQPALSRNEDRTPVPSRLACHEESVGFREHATAAVPTDSPLHIADSHDRYQSVDDVQYSPTSKAESTFSHWPGRSNATESSISSIADNGPKSRDNRPISTDSFVMMTTDDVLRSQDSVADIAASMNDINFSSSRDLYSLNEATDLSSFPNVPGPAAPRLNVDYNPEVRRSTVQTETKIVLGIQGSKKHLEGSEPSSNGADISAQGSSRPYSRTQNRRPAQNRHHEVTHMQRNIMRMRAATPKIILERLKEQWTDVADATIYKELEFEKQLWMLTGLELLTSKVFPSGSSIEGNELQTASPSHVEMRPKVLSLYENQACASFLATFASVSEVHHITPLPMSPITTAPKLQSTISASPHIQLPYGASTFTAIHALNLASILSSPTIPPLLRECNRVLTPNGILHLTIIDPSPISSTTGPHLRRWLDKHLLLPLETQFRCLKPSRLLPIWLQDAGFNLEMPPGGQPKSTRVRFLAVGRGEGGFVDSTPDETDTGSKELSQLNAVVGRMLWREIWGGFVVGERWWWEDDKVVEECASRGTRWDCTVLEVTKRI